MNAFDVIIIGFGKGGKTLAAEFAKRGQKVAIIERSDKMYGGTCINDAGKPVILTTDTTKRELIRKLAGCDEVVVLPCAISYRYLKNVDDKIKSCLGDRPGLIEKVGINTFGILTDKNCVDVSLVCCTPEKVELFKSLVVDDPCITFSENVSRVVLQ